MREQITLANSWDFDFETIPRNTRLVLETVYVSKTVAHEWQPRPDGLHDVIFLRAKKTVDKRQSPRVEHRAFALFG